jgi:hypothetical protein
MMTRFAGEIRRGELSVSRERRSMDKSLGNEALQEQSMLAGLGLGAGPGEQTPDQQIEARAFDPGFAMTRVFPRHEATEKDGSARIMILETLKELEPSYVDKSSPEAIKVIRQLIASRQKGKSLRKLAYELFRANPFATDIDTCSQQGWPCLRADARRWANALFPETLFEGMTIPSSGIPHGQIETSLDQERYIDRVMQISAQQLGAILTAPNDRWEKRDP